MTRLQRLEWWLALGALLATTAATIVFLSGCGGLGMDPMWQLTLSSKLSNTAADPAYGIEAYHQGTFAPGGEWPLARPQKEETPQ